MENNILIKPYRHSGLAKLYGVSWKTLQRWLKPHKDLIGPKSRHYYSATQVRIIFEILGQPEVPLLKE